MHTTELYFESHITIEPVFDGHLLEVKDIVECYGFKVADLLMKKREKDTETRSKYDTFCTTRSKSYQQIENNTLACVDRLTNRGFKVWRYKIENTLIDVRLK